MAMQSQGAATIEKLLKQNKLLYQKEVTFPQCKDKYVLPFDFGVKCRFTGTWICLIEYDGEQHYYPVSKFGGADGHRKTLKHDAIKNRFCLLNGIPLIRIPYWMKDIVQINDLIPVTTQYLVRNIYHNERYLLDPILRDKVRPPIKKKGKK